MMFDRVKAAIPFPDPRTADGATGLVAIGGDLSPDRLVSAYAHGIFPWYSENPILWFSPDPRMVLRLPEVEINRTLRKNLRRRRFEVRLDTAFHQVIRACATAPRPDQDGTWITDDMIEGYEALHERGYAHCVEAWCEGELVGGMYGVSLGAAFFGESMYASSSEASKIAFVHLVRQLERWNFQFLVRSTLSIWGAWVRRSGREKNFFALLIGLWSVRPGVAGGSSIEIFRLKFRGYSKTTGSSRYVS